MKSDDGEDVGGHKDEERKEKSTDQSEYGVQMLLPGRRVKSIRNALEKVFHKGSYTKLGINNTPQ